MQLYAHVTYIALRMSRYVLERMRMSSVADRLQTILETDWKSEAIELLAHRQATGEGPVCLLACLFC